MYWIAFWYLAYIWRTRALQSRECVNCKFFLPPTDNLSDPANIRFGKCLNYPYGEHKIHELVIGMDEPALSGLYRYALTARTSETMCGHAGNNYIKKPILKNIRIHTK